MKKIAPFLVLLAGILWGTMGIFVRTLNAHNLTTIEIVAVRAVATTLLMFIYLLIFDRKKLKIRLKDIWCFLGTGLCSIVFFNFCYFKAITMTSLSVAAVLLYTAPAIVMILSALLFHEKITGIKIISIVMTFAGCLFVTGIIGSSSTSSGANGRLSTAGILIGLGAGLGYALYSIFSRFAINRGYHSMTITFYTFLFAIFGSVPLCRFHLIIDAAKDDNFMIIFYLIFGLMSTVLPYIVYTLGLSQMENSQASILASIEPVTASILGVLLFHEVISIGTFVGIILVLGAIMLDCLHKD